MKLTRFKQTQTGTCTLCCLAALSFEALPTFNRAFVSTADLPLVAPAFGLAAIPYPPVFDLAFGVYLAYLQHASKLGHAILIDNRNGDFIVYDPERPELQFNYNDFALTFGYEISFLFLLQEAHCDSTIFALTSHEANANQFFSSGDVNNETQNAL